MIPTMQPSLLSPAINGELGFGNNEVPSCIRRECFEGNQGPD